MRRLADPSLIHRFMRALGLRGAREVCLYFTGGATAVLMGWRASTIDVDILLVPDDDQLLRSLPELKEELQINVELACPAHFIPELIPHLYRYPAINPRAFQQAVEGTIRRFQKSPHN